MKEILFYVGGMITVWFLAPIFHKFQEVIILWLESRKANSQKKILDANKEMVMMQEFIKSPEEQYYYEVEYIDGDEDDE
jgi:hypothetical protein